MKCSIFSAILALLVFSLHAQKLTVSDLTISDQGIVSFSCIVAAHHSSREVYELKVFSSIDDFEKSLPLDINKLRPEIPLSVSFDGNKVIGDFDGSIEFDFALTATFFPVEIVPLGKKFKKGKEINISWEDFNESGWYEVEIYKDNLLFQKLVGNHRGTSYVATLPKDMPKGKYEIRVTPSNQKELVSEGYEVNLKSGKAGLIIGAGGALVGGAVLLLKSGNKENELPVPPNLPGN